VIEEPSQHHAVPNLLTGQPQNVQQVEVIGDLLLLMALLFYRLAVAFQQRVDLVAGMGFVASAHYP
jgi:hypothetical protein